MGSESGMVNGHGGRNGQGRIGSDVSINGKGIEGRVGGEEEEGGMEGKRVYQ